MTRWYRNGHATGTRHRSANTDRALVCARARSTSPGRRSARPASSAARALITDWAVRIRRGARPGGARAAARVAARSRADRGRRAGGAASGALRRTLEARGIAFEMHGPGRGLPHVQRAGAGAARSGRRIIPLRGPNGCGARCAQSAPEEDTGRKDRSTNQLSEADRIE